MKRYIPLILDTWALIAWALWLGGLAVCWLVLRPAVYSLPSEAVPTAQKVFDETLRRFSGVIEVCGLILAAMQWVLRRRYERDRTLFVVDGSRMVVVFVALFCAEYGRYVLIPALHNARAAAAASATLAGMAIAQSVLLIGYAAITGWLQSQRLSAAPTPAPKPAGKPISQPPRPVGKGKPRKSV